MYTINLVLYGATLMPKVMEVQSLKQGYKISPWGTRPRDTRVKVIARLITRDTPSYRKEIHLSPNKVQPYAYRLS